jgi:hypothetical protein
MGCFMWMPAVPPDKLPPKCPTSTDAALIISNKAKKDIHK